jgi:hypothetical protein
MIEETRGDIPESAIRGVVGQSISPSGRDAIVVLELDVNTRGEALAVSVLCRRGDGEWSENTSTTMSWGRWAGLGGAFDGLGVVFAERLEPGACEAVVRLGDERHVVSVRSDGVLFFAQWGHYAGPLLPRWIELEEVR